MIITENPQRTGATCQAMAAKQDGGIDFEPVRWGGSDIASGYCSADLTIPTAQNPADFGVRRCSGGAHQAQQQRS